ncbi:carboxypeptidase regulatory-like domain-containing protein [Actinoplanes sp. CA-131856]
MRRAPWAPLLALCLLSACGGDTPPPQAPASGTPASGATSHVATPGVPEAQGARGRVTGAAGAALPGAAVAREPIDPVRPINLQAAVTGADGRYAWPLEPGVWELSFTADGYRPATRRVTVVANRWQETDVHLQPA